MSISAKPSVGGVSGSNCVGVGNDIVEFLMQESVVRFDPGCEFLILVVPGVGALEIALVEVVFLECDDGGREVVGIQIVGIVANKPLKRAEVGWRKDMMIAHRPQGFEVVAGLALACRFLQLLVGNIEPRKFVAGAED